MLPYYTAHMEPGRAGGGSSSMFDFLKPKHSSFGAYLDDEDFMKEMGTILQDNKLTKGYAAADQPFDYTKAGGGQAKAAVAMPEITAGAGLFGMANPYFKKLYQGNR